MAGKLSTRIGLPLLLLALACAVGEVIMRVLELPLVLPAPEQLTGWVAFLPEADGDLPVYLNPPSFGVSRRYATNPRGYFDEHRRVVHFTNAAGFRGREFTTAPASGSLRIACVGDSITFGEGVWFEDTWPEQLVGLLGEGDRIECLNFGVAGYNTLQEAYAVKRWVLPAKPDLVVVGFALDDAEPVLFGVDRETGLLARRLRVSDVSLQRGDPIPPAGLLYRLRIIQALWGWHEGRQRTRRMNEHYAALYDEAASGWDVCHRSMALIAARCAAEDIPLVVVCFPPLLSLDDYALADVHGDVREQFSKLDLVFIDLLPLLAERDERELWVHRTDQHPNEQVHHLAALAITQAIRRDERLAGIRSRLP